MTRDESSRRYREALLETVRYSDTEFTGPVIDLMVASFENGWDTRDIDTEHVGSPGLGG